MPSEVQRWLDDTSRKVRRSGQRHPNIAMAVMIILSLGLAVSSAFGILRARPRDSLLGVVLLASISLVDLLAGLSVVFLVKPRDRVVKPRASPLSTGVFLGLVSLVVLIRGTGPLVRHSVFLAIAGFMTVFLSGLAIRQGRLLPTNIGTSERTKLD